jgi:drug/metabolite transporter (DMT)-like permease
MLYITSGVIGHSFISEYNILVNNLYIVIVTFTTLALGSAVLGAVANIMARTLLKNIKPTDMMVLNFLTMSAVLALFSPMFYHFEISILSFALLVSIAAIDTLANYFLFTALEKYEASRATPLLSLAPGFTFFFSWLFIGQVVSWQTYIFAIVIIASVMVFSLEKGSGIKDFKHIWPILMCSICYGISAIPSSYLLNNLGSINAPTLYMFRGAFISIFCIMIFQMPLKAANFQNYRFIFIRCLVVIGQWLLLYYALTIGNAGVSLTLSNITPILVFIFGIVFLKEKMTLRKGIAAAMVFLFAFLIK